MPIESLLTSKNKFSSLYSKKLPDRQIRYIVYMDFATQRYLRGSNVIYYIAFEISVRGKDDFSWSPKDDHVQIEKGMPDSIKDKFLFIQPILVKKSQSDFAIAFIPRTGTQTKYGFARQFDNFKPMVALPESVEAVNEYMHSVIDSLIRYDEKHYRATVR